MRVITGTAKSIPLISLDRNTRPLSDRAKVALFSIINEKIPESDVLDLYAGSGALGIECLSRGARTATFVDKAKRSIESIEINLEKTRLQDQAEIIKGDVEDYCKEADMEQFDIIFVCPPYPKVKFTIPALASDLLKPYGILIFEHHSKDKFDDLANLKKIDKRNYGIVQFDIYQKL